MPPKEAISAVGKALKCLRDIFSECAHESWSLPDFVTPDWGVFPFSGFILKQLKSVTKVIRQHRPPCLPSQPHFLLSSSQDHKFPDGSDSCMCVEVPDFLRSLGLGTYSSL